MSVIREDFEKNAVNQDDPEIYMKEFPSHDVYVKERQVFFKSWYGLHPINWSVFKEKQFPEGEWRIKNLIPKEGLVILASPSGEKKSWIALEMGKCVVKGMPFLGNDLFATEPCNVLYIDQEMSAGELQRRGKQLNISENENQFLMITNENEKPINFSMDEDVDEFFEILKQHNIKLVFIDTLRAVAGGLKEDKAEDVREFFNRFRQVKNKGIAIVFLDHCRKPNHFEGKTPKKEQLLGSQDKTASIEVLLMLKSEPGSDDIAMYSNKNRISKECDPFKIIMKDEMDDYGNIKTALEYSRLQNEEQSQKERAIELILFMLEDGERSKKEIRAYMVEKRIGQRNCDDALRSLVGDEKINYRQEGRQRLYFLKVSRDSHEIDSKEDELSI